MAVRLRRMNNYDYSYQTLDGKYEVINYHKSDSDYPSEWTIVQWQPYIVTIDTFPTLRQCREALAEMIQNGTY